jgi:hypothetical protein
MSNVAFLRVTQQQASPMYAEGKLPEPQRIDGIGPLWKPGGSSDGQARMVGERNDGGRGLEWRS